jgi:iron(III) transport system permease protein
MSRWRFALAVLLLLVVGIPLTLPLGEALLDLSAWPLWSERARFVELAGNTLRLAAGTLALALPAGIVGAVLLYRTDLPLRRELRGLIVLTLFVPLPLFASGWQAALGSGGLFSFVSTESSIWRPWDQGLRAAIWIHAVAGLPWVVWLVGRGLCWVEPELEEDALTAASPWRVLWHVTVRRSGAAIGAAALWVGLQTATEVTVTDLMQVRTYAEEVYNQFVASDRALVPRLVAVAFPSVLLAGILVAWTTQRWQQTLPPLTTLAAVPRLLPLGRLRWPCFTLVLAAVSVLVLVPLVSLIWKGGLAGSPEAWSLGALTDALAKASLAGAKVVRDSLLLAAGAGGVAALLAVIACWLAVESRGFRFLVVALMAVAWAMPAPIVGVGLKDTIEFILASVPSKPLSRALYYGPSLLPVLWVDIIRFFPCAVAVLWPIVRLLPPELRDAARVDGARPWQELHYVVIPLTLLVIIRAGLAVAVLSLGELGAGKLVAPPESGTFAQELFSQMHYGTGRDVAALCLLLLLPVLLGGLLVALAGNLRSPGWLRREKK